MICLFASLFSFCVVDRSSDERSSPFSLSPLINLLAQMHKRDVSDMHLPAGLDILRPRHRRRRRGGVRGRLLQVRRTVVGPERELRVQAVGTRREPAGV